MDIKRFKGRLKTLTADEIKELNVIDAERILANNANLIIDLEKVLFDEIGEKGKHSIAVDQLISIKKTIIEQNRALKTVIQNG